MPNEKPDKNPMIKTISGSRLKRLIEIDAILSRRGSEDNPATIAEICDELKIPKDNKDKRRGIRKIKKNHDGLGDNSSPNHHISTRGS